MDLELAGKFGIVTGGSAGIGLACARALYNEGVSVLIVARETGRLAEAETAIRRDPPATPHPTSNRPQVVTLSADMSKAEDINRVVETAMSRFGQIDILIN